MPTLLGLNVLAQTVHDRAALFAYLQRAQPALVVVMDDVGLARQLKHALPNTLVVHRRSHPDQQHWHEKVSPAQWLEMHRADAEGGLILQCFNEPGTQDYKALARWCADLMALADDVDISLALPNFSVGNPSERRIQDGEFDDLLKAFDQYPRHYLALHEYANANPSLEQPYHIGRYREWLTRAGKLGLRAPRILITETGRDVGGGYQDGWREVMSEEQYVAFLRKLAAAYRPDNIPAAIYCYGTGGGGDWNYFDLQGANTVLDALPEMGQIAMPEPTVPVWTPHFCKPNGSYNVNVRAAGDSNAERVALLPAEGRTIDLDTATEGNWRRVRVDGVEGYVSAAYVTFTAIIEPEPEPEPEPEIPDPDTLYSVFLTEDELRQVAEKEEAIAALYRQLVEQYRVLADEHAAIAAIYRAAAERSIETPVEPLVVD